MIGHDMKVPIRSAMLHLKSILDGLDQLMEKNKEY